MSLGHMTRLPIVEGSPPIVRLGCETAVMAAVHKRPPVLSDGIVLLRPPQPQDAADVARGCQDREIARWTTVPSPYSLDHATDWLTQHETDTPDGVDRWWAKPVWAITMGDDRWLGTVDLRPDGEGAASVGYLVAPWARGKGVATRALRLGCRWGFTALGLQVIQWRAGVGNDASRTVATRVGFHVAAEPQRQAIAVRGARTDCWFGDLLPDEVTEAGTGRRRQRSGPKLTAREFEVLDQMAAGHSNRVIATTLGISENTVKNHVRRILEKLQAGSRMEAVVLSFRQGLTRLP